MVFMFVRLNLKCDIKLTHILAFTFSYWVRKIARVGVGFHVVKL